MKKHHVCRHVVVVAVTLFPVVGRAGVGLPPTAPCRRPDVRLHWHVRRPQTKRGSTSVGSTWPPAARRGSGAVSGIENPSFQALHPNGRFLYSVSEIGRLRQVAIGRVRLPRMPIDPGDGPVDVPEQSVLDGCGACHVSCGPCRPATCWPPITPAAVSSSCRSSRTAAWTCRVHSCSTTGSSVHPRQKEPHAHCINLDPADQRSCWSPILARIRCVIYQYDRRQRPDHAESRDARRRRDSRCRPAPFRISSRGQFGYVINELNSTVTAFAYDGTSGG